MRSQSDRSLVLFGQVLELLDSMVGMPGRYLKIPSAPVVPPLWLVAYDAVPEVGSTTVFTFGISSVRHESWIAGRAPELVISLNTTDDDWWLALAAFCLGLRGICPFSLGTVLRLGRRISAQSEMSAYLLFWPTILDKDQQHLNLPDRCITFVQAYPIFDSEVGLIAQLGPENFFMLEGVDFDDTTRHPVTLPNSEPT